MYTKILLQVPLKPILDFISVYKNVESFLNKENYVFRFKFIKLSLITYITNK